jgi:tRNA pseudouridine13 synthase
MQNRYFYSHDKIDFLFNKDSNNFVVKENPLYEFSGDGEHLIVVIRKKNLTTWELIEHIANTLDIKVRDVGYAGLKDKHSMSIQHISVLKKYEDLISKIETSQIKILNKFCHKNKLKIGHLKSNDFTVMFKKVDRVNAHKLSCVLKDIKAFGLPNYFGFQRFGNDGLNHQLGEKIIEKNKKIRNKRDMFLANAYQSKLFNDWLSKRVEMSIQIDSFTNIQLEELGIKDSQIYKNQPHKFKIYQGDLMHHYPYGKIFNAQDLQKESQRFFDKQIVPTGGLCGKDMKKPDGIAYEIEENFDKISTLLNGSRRFAWIFVDNIEYQYKEDEMQYLLKFTLPKGSYATTLIEELSHKEIKNEL